MSDPLNTFRTEANEHLVALEEALLEMEERPDDSELIDQAFRSLHTIKGAGGMFGFDDLSAFTHHLENALDKVRQGLFQINSELVSIILDAKDQIEDLLISPQTTVAQRSINDTLIGRLRRLIPDETSAAVAATPEKTDKPKDTANEQSWRIRITPASTAFQDGFDCLPILRELQALGSCNVTTSTEQIPALDKIDPENCHFIFDVILTTDQDKSAIEDCFIFVQDDWKIVIDIIDDDESSRLGEILINRGDVTKEKIEQLLDQQPKTGELLKQQGLASESQINSALAEQQVVRKKHEKTQQTEDAMVRVPAAKLDALVDLVGELVIVQSRINQLAIDRDEEEITAVAEEMERLTLELRENTFDIRMLPIGTTFSRFKRLVRDLSRDLGKEVQLVTEGAETELDKTVIDKLADPLVHLIRNSIDHGIETPQQRQQSGKSAQGTVRLTAEHAESHVLIRIEDDGAGLDPNVIRAKAIERGLITADELKTDHELFQLIFEPGFSTAKTVSNVSGRGVGMDVVKRSIDALRGEVKLDSTPGVGTVLTIVLPLTLAIIEGLMVEVDQVRYVVPLALVEECIEHDVESLTANRGRSLIEVRGDLVPYLSLREWFGRHDDSPSIQQIVVTRFGGTRFGIAVDEVIGQHQTVIKTLGKLYEGFRGQSGATILGDGSVALILDVPRLMEDAALAQQKLH